MRAPAWPWVPSSVFAALIPACGPTAVDAVELVPQARARSDLVAHWSFDDAAGMIARDDSGNRYDGHLIGGTWIPDGRFGGALRLARGDYVAVNGFQDATPGWTVSAWLRVAPGDITDWGSLLSTEILQVGGWQLYTDHVRDVPDLNFEYSLPSSGGSYRVVDCCQPVATGVWHHVTAVVAPGAITLYEGTQVQTSAPLSAPLAPGDPTLYMGWWAGSDGLFAGAIDDVSIYARALAEDEIARIDAAAVPAGP